MHRETAHAHRPTAAGARDDWTTLTRAWPALPATAVIVFVLLRLAFDQGGYFPAAYTAAGAIAFISLAVLVLRPSQERFSTHALIALASLAAFACWTGLSRTWSVVPDVPVLDMQRAMLYVALFGLGLLAADSGRNARLLVWCVLGVVVVLVGAGLLSRLQPDVVQSTIDPFVAPFYRLDHPFGYWNAFGALASIGAVLAIGLAADTRGSVILRGAAAGAAVMLVVAMYLSLSRGGWLALILGLVVLVAIAPKRGSLLLALVIAGGAAVVAILRLGGYPALVLDPKTGSGQAAQGNAFTRELVGLVLLAVVAQAALTRVRVSSLLEQQMRTVVRFALIGGGILVVVVALAGYVAKGDQAEGRVTTAVDDATGWLDRQWQDFLNPALSPGAGTARLVSAKGARSDGYRVAIDGFEASPLIGGGAGSFEVRYARDRDIDVKIRDAHSLPLETLSELGVVGMLLLLGFLGAVAAAARRTIVGKGALRPAEGAAVTGAFVVWLGHASVDWDWEMPALTGAAVVLSAALFQRGRRRRSHGRRATST
ncbi:MAG: O-antigen ligase family protein [Solirubrobacterales bacterium]|nr:O-antigen ligase family protein [Solirubrobacterales bacterium]